MPLIKVKLEVVVCVEADNLPQGLDYALDLIQIKAAIPATGSGVLVTRKSQIPFSWQGKKPFNAKTGAISSSACEEIVEKKK